MNDRPIRVLLVDDHAVVRKGLRALLDRDPGIEVVGEAVDGEEAVRAAGRLGPDVILYPRDETALRHGAGVEVETPAPREAYARFTRPAPDVDFREEFLTG